jgi:hypothetical protein
MYFCSEQLSLRPSDIVYLNNYVFRSLCTVAPSPSSRSATVPQPRLVAPCKGVTTPPAIDTEVLRREYCCRYAYVACLFCYLFLYCPILSVARLFVCFNLFVILFLYRVIVFCYFPLPQFVSTAALHFIAQTVDTSLTCPRILPCLRTR